MSAEEKAQKALAEELTAKIKQAFPDVKLKFEVIEQYLTIKPESFLGSEVFANLKIKITELQGEYVSAGKLSHFRISLTSDSKDESNLKDWYSNQKLKSQPLPFTLTLNLNLQVTTEQLEDLLKTVASLQQKEDKK